jgi:exopolysaccharide production protein ExoQ
MAMSIVYVLFRPGLALSATMRYWTLWLYCIFAAVSTLWSFSPEVTLRASIQVLFTTGSALVMARALPAKSFLTVLMSAMLVADAASVINPRMAWNQGAHAMIGIFGSKNAFGFVQGLLILAAVWVFLDTSRNWILRGLALLSAIGGSYLLLVARSVGATVDLLAALAVSILAFELRRLPTRPRIVFLCIGGLLTTIVCGFGLVFADDIFSAALQYFDKSITLSDRTPLWEVAAKMMKENPILGVGYQAFWIDGNPYAEDLYQRLLIPRKGFGFHNLWYQAGVELGYVGLCLAILTVAATTLAVGRWTIRSASPSNCFFLGYMVYIVTASGLEVMLFGQFSLTWILFVAAWAYALQALERHEAGTRIHIRIGKAGDPTSKTYYMLRELDSAMSVFARLHVTPDAEISNNLQLSPLTAGTNNRHITTALYSNSRARRRRGSIASTVSTSCRKQSSG